MIMSGVFLWVSINSAPDGANEPASAGQVAWGIVGILSFNAAMTVWILGKLS